MNSQNTKVNYSSKLVYRASLSHMEERGYVVIVRDIPFFTINNILYLKDPNNNIWEMVWIVLHNCAQSNFWFQVTHFDWTNTAIFVIQKLLQQSPMHKLLCLFFIHIFMHTVANNFVFICWWRKLFLCLN